MGKRGALTANLNTLNGPRAMHLKGSGNLARWLVVPFGSILLTLAAAYIINGERSTVAGSRSGWPVAAAFVIVIILQIARSTRLGIWLSKDRVVIRSWFKTLTLMDEQDFICNSVPYTGLFMYGRSRTFNMLEIRLPDGGAFDARATIARRKTSAAQRDLVLTYAGKSLP